MRICKRGCAAAFLLVALSGCSTGESLFSTDAGAARAQAVEPTAADDSCSRVAAQRADDAVLALYVAADSDDQKRIYEAAYRECAGWHAHQP